MQPLRETRVDLRKVLGEIALLDFKEDGSGAKMLLGPCAGVPFWLQMKCPELHHAVQEIAYLRGVPALHVMVNILPPGIAVPVHQDWLKPTKHQPVQPTVERWHLALQTNPLATFWHDGDPEIHVPAGVWYGPVKYWIKHTVYNRGKEDRVHVVVDLDTPERQGEYAN